MKLAARMLRHASPNGVGIWSSISANERPTTSHRRTKNRGFGSYPIIGLKTTQEKYRIRNPLANFWPIHLPLNLQPPTWKSLPVVD
jgi:hypothetical protein